MSGWTFLALTVTATVLAQILFKKSHIENNCLYTLEAIFLFCLAVPCTFFAAKQLGIGLVYIGSASSYVLTPLLAVWLFKEDLDHVQWAALGLIVLGIIIYSV